MSEISVEITKEADSEQYTFTGSGFTQAEAMALLSVMQTFSTIDNVEMEVDGKVVDISLEDNDAT